MKKEAKNNYHVPEKTWDGWDEQKRRLFVSVMKSSNQCEIMPGGVSVVCRSTWMAVRRRIAFGAVTLMDFE